MSSISPYEVKSAIEKVKNDYSFLSRIPTNLVMGICEIESDFNPNAIGGAGEIGIMQVKPATAQWLDGLYQIPLYSPRVQNNVNNQLLHGMLFLRWLFDRGIGYVAVIHSYNQGYQGYKDGRRNWRYVAKVLERNLRWTV